jgi:cell wall-associated NlpC family hydrolase
MVRPTSSQRASPPPKAKLPGAGSADGAPKFPVPLAGPRPEGSPQLSLFGDKEAAPTAATRLPGRPVEEEPRLSPLLAQVRARLAPDRRIDLLEVRLEPRGGGRAALEGLTTCPQALDALFREVCAALHPVPVADEVVRLPPYGSAQAEHAQVRTAAAFMHSEARIASTCISQQPLGARVQVLFREGSWAQVRGEDGYLGWIHQGSLCPPQPAPARAARSLGVELADALGAPVVFAPLGARLALDADGAVRLPGGQRVSVVRGALVEEERRADRFPADGAAIAQSALGWRGTQYVWGGLTPLGTDCSGLTQAVFGLHGVALPRDADQQSKVGEEVPLDQGLAALLPGDLLFFAEPGKKVSHVALSLGAGRIVHSSLANGGVAVDDLAADDPVATVLRAQLVLARRVLRWAKDAT